MIKMTQWVLEKFSEDNFLRAEQSENYDMENMQKELNEYLMILKKLFYV
jgi:hypothetical protein